VPLVVGGGQFALGFSGAQRGARLRFGQLDVLRVEPHQHRATLDGRAHVHLALDDLAADPKAQLRLVARPHVT